MILDPRVTLARGDLAAASLEGVSPAARYATPDARRMAAPSTGLFARPDTASELLDQLLYGEMFDVLAADPHFAFGQARRDGHVGYVAIGALGEPGPPPTHRIAAVRSFAFAERDIKSRAIGPFPPNGLVSIVEWDGRFARDDQGAWFMATHLAPIGVFEHDPAQVALRFLGTPYLWGGRNGFGLDCSGLVQQALMACGIGCPRDSDLQMTLGQPADSALLQRNDLVFWEGHVGMMLDTDTLLHANAHHMAVAAEPLGAAIARIGEATSGRPIAYRRLPSLGQNL